MPSPQETGQSPTSLGVEVKIDLASGEKCLRCWKVLPDVGKHKHPGVCERCTDAVDVLQAAE